MKPELVAALFGTALAGFAGVMSILKRISVRKKERLSVRPYLELSREIQKEKPIRIILKNTGKGAAFVDSFEVLAGNVLPGEKKQTNLSAAVVKLGLSSSDIICYTPSKEEEIPAKGMKILFEANPINSQEHEKICSLLPGLTFKIKYSSLYDEKFQL